MHVWRVEQIKKRITKIRFSHTVIWTSIVVSLSVAALVLELYFGILYPYLDRENAVKISDGDEGGRS